VTSSRMRASLWPKTSPLGLGAHGEGPALCTASTVDLDAARQKWITCPPPGSSMDLYPARRWISPKLPLKHRRCTLARFPLARYLSGSFATNLRISFEHTSETTNPWSKHHRRSFSPASGGT